MKIINEQLIISRADLDHILEQAEEITIVEEYDGDKPLSNIFLRGLEEELRFCGMEEELFNDIIIKDIWEGLNEK